MRRALGIYLSSLFACMPDFRQVPAESEGVDAGPVDTGVRESDARVDAAEPDASATYTADPRIPALPASCPTFTTGMVTVDGRAVQLWVGAKQAGKKGPLVFYWHGAGNTSGEASLLGAAQQDVLDAGGIVAAFTTTTKQGADTFNGTWYTGDFALADQLVACAVANHDIDPRRIYSAGCAAGGVQASAMAYARSSYLAAALPNSGGVVNAVPLEDAAHVPAVMAAHGSKGTDVLFVDFSQATEALTKDLAARGGFVVVCEHGGGHCGSSAAIKAAQWELARTHPFGVTPEPYANGLPVGFPSQCKVVAK